MNDEKNNKFQNQNINIKKITLFKKKEETYDKESNHNQSQWWNYSQVTHSLDRKNYYKILKIKHPVLSKELMIFYDLGYLEAKNFF